MNSPRPNANWNDDVRTKKTNSPRPSKKCIDSGEMKIDNGKTKIDNAKTNSPRSSEKWIDGGRMKIDGGKMKM